MQDAIILAGGKATRLQGVVTDRPKSMVEVAGRPFVEWLLLSLRAQGIKRVVFCTGYMSESIEAYFRSGEHWDMEVVYSRDPIPLGTAGAVRYALDQIHSKRFLVMNGDSYCPVSYKRLEEVHRTREADATLWLVHVENCSRFGSVHIGSDGGVQAFHEKSQENRPGLINAGTYLLERKLVETIPKDKAVSLETEFFPQLIGQGLYAVIGEGPFIDIGTPEELAVADDVFSKEFVT